MSTTTTETTTTKAKYKYLTKARIDSTIKKHGLEVAYTKGDGYFYFLDLKTGDKVGESVMVAKMHRLSIQEWRDAAAAARGTVADGYAEAKAAATADAQVRKLVETWDDAVEATQEELVQAQA